MMRNMFAEQQGDPFDYTDKYNTPLTPDEERRFQAWARKNPQRLKDLYDYDVRGFWKAGRKTSGNGHGGDEFKKPNHPTFSTYSNYSSPLRQGGTWVAPAIPRQDYGGYTFFASPDLTVCTALPA